MRNILLIAVIASFMLMQANAYAAGESVQKITFLGAEVELGEVAHTKLTITFDQNSAISSFTLPLFYDIQNLKADANFGNASCTSQKKQFGSQIECAVSPTSEKRMLNLEYDSFDLTQKIDKQLLYKQEFHVPMETTQLSFKVMLPEGMFLSSGGTFQQYLPVNGEKGSDGRRIFISWRKENLTGGESFDTQIFYEASSDNSGTVALFAGGIVGLGAVIVALIIGFWLFFKRFKKNIKIVLPVLKSDEKEIMELLIKGKGNSNQKLLVRESNYSKAKVSKILSSLKERGIINLERIGRSNNVYLAKDFSKSKKEPDKNEEKHENQDKEETTMKQDNVQKSPQKKHGGFKSAGNYIPLRELKKSGPPEAAEEPGEKDEESE